MKNGKRLSAPIVRPRAARAARREGESAERRDREREREKAGGRKKEDEEAGKRNRDAFARSKGLDGVTNRRRQ